MMNTQTNVDMESRVWITIYSDTATRPEMEELLQIRELWNPPKRTSGRDYSGIDVRRRPNGLHIFSDLTLDPASPIEEHLDWAANYISENVDRISAFLGQSGNTGMISIVCVTNTERIDYAIEPKTLAVFERAGLTLQFSFEYDGP